MNVRQSMVDYVILLQSMSILGPDIEDNGVSKLDNRGIVLPVTFMLISFINLNFCCELAIGLIVEKLDGFDPFW